MHTTVLVPLYVPHDGHFFTPLLVDLPKSDKSAAILSVCAIVFRGQNYFGTNATRRVHDILVNSTNVFEIKRRFESTLNNNETDDGFDLPV